MESKEIKPVNPKGNQSWVFIGRTEAEDETPMIWPPDAKNWLIGKEPEAGKAWGQEKGGIEMKWLDGIIDSMDMSLSKLRGIEGQGACYSSWGHKESDTTEWLNNNNRMLHLFFKLTFQCMVLFSDITKITFPSHLFFFLNIFSVMFSQKEFWSSNNYKGIINFLN